MKDESKSKELLIEEITNLKAQLRQKKKELTDTQQSLIAAINSLDDMLFYKNSKCAYLGCNKAVLNFFNLQPKDIIGKTDFDLFPKEIAERHKNDDKKILKEGAKIQYENWLTTSKGKKILIEVHKSPMRDKKGKIIGIIGISRDISKRYLNEEKLKILQFGVDKSKIGICQISEDGKIQYVNDFLCQQSGYTREELLKLSIADIDATMNLSQWKKNREKIKAGFSNTFESIQINKDGTQIPVEITVNYFEYDKELISFSFVKYIAEQLEAKKALLESEEHLRTTLNSITDAVISIDSKGIIRGMNPSAEKLTGWSIAEALGCNFSKVMNVIDRNTGKKQQSVVNKVLETGKKLDINKDITLISKTGKKYQIFKSDSPITNSEGKITGVVVIIRDITKEQHFLDALHRSQSNLEKAQEIAHMGSWELNLSTGYGFWSKEMFQLFRRDPELGIASFEEFLYYVHEDDRKLLREANKQAIKNRMPFHTQIRTNPEVGEIRIISVQFECKFSKSKKETILYGTCIDVTEQKKTDQALKESEARFRGLVEASPDAIFITDYSSRMLYANPTLKVQTGYTADDFQMEQKENKFIHPDDADKVGQFLIDFINSENTYSEAIQNRFIDIWGNTHWYSSRVAKINFEGQPALQFITRDITEEQKIQDALVKSEKGYRTLFETMTQGVVYQDADGKIISANPAAQKILGLSLDQLMGRTSMDPRWRSIHEDGSDLPGEEHPAMQTLKTGKPVKDEIIGIYIPENDEYRWILVSAMPEFKDNEKQPYQVFTTFTDITEIKHAENLIKQNTVMLEESQQIASLGHYVFDIQTGKWQNSPMLDVIFGIDESYDKSIEGWINLIHNEFKAEMSSYLQDFVIKQGNRFDKEYKIIRQNDDTERWVHGYGRLEHDADGNVIHMIGTIQDIHDRKVLEEQLMQSQKMEAIGQLAGGVAHDFNNMLTVINGYSEMLLYKDLHPEFRGLIQEILNASTKASRLTSQLLAFSRKQIIQPKVLNLNQVVTDQIKMLRRLLGEDVEVSTAFEPQLRPIKADIGQIEQIIMNISINARDAMPLGGKLIIETKNIEFDEVDVKHHPEIKPGSYTMLSITDTGVGMDDVTRTRIFEPFYTTKGRDKGTGLGLATVYGIVKQNDGFIYVDSEIQKGSSFKVYLLSSDEKEKDNKTAPIEDEKLKGTETILLVEDDEGVRVVTQNTLQNYGYSVVTATNGEEALRIYDEHEGKFDLVLTDVVMPLMSGREMADKLRGKDSSIKILYFSGYTDNSIVQHGVLDEGMEFIQKPYSHAELAKKVKSVLNK